MKKIAIVGYKGKMGGPIFLALEKNFNVIGIGREDSLDNYSDVDLVIDSATATSSVDSAEYCLKHGIPIIIVATGQSMAQLEKIEEISKYIEVIKKPNFSCCIQILKNFIVDAIKLRPTRVEIVEVHHVNKKDSPSGTAIELKKFIESIYFGKVDVVSVRRWDEMGEHSISFYFGDETLLVKHNVFSRDVFVRGVVADVKKYLKIDKQHQNLEH